MLKRYRDTKTGPEKKLPCTVNTFGFGYQLDSVLLRDLAIEGGGAYSFIPDSGFVGTVFVNSLSNLLVTFGQQLRMTLEPLAGSEIVEVFGGHPCQKVEAASQLQL